ncbi:MAG: hypothetical protein JO370_03085, partial [Paucibacter sp.]|nr:hypothetical protein [Roseateles sp.]
MTDNSFTKFVPGFDFLQGLVKNAGAALPGIGQWVAPTLNPEELARRIEELRTVQFWLEQNARMLSTTIQAMEVQRMTLSTLQTMNVPLSELQDKLKVPTPDLSNWPGPSAKAQATPAKKTSRVPPQTEPAEPAVPPAVDPMQWWSALTQQFTQLATNALKETTTDAAKSLAGSLVKQSIDAAGETLKKAVAVPGAVAGSVANSVASSMAQTIGKTVSAKPAETARSTAATAAPRRKPAAKNTA